MRAQVGDVKLYFDVEGAQLVADGASMQERPTLLLLHGGPGFDHSTYKPAFSTFADIAQIVYLDHRGNGRSDAGGKDKWRLDQWADDVRSFCDVLGIEKPIVAGQSFGGMVAMAYAIRHPDHPGKLILSSTTARTRHDRVVAKFRELGGDAVAAAADRYWSQADTQSLRDYARLCYPLYNRRPPDADASARVRWNFEVMLDFANGEDRAFNLLPNLHRITCPTLILGGEDDPITPLADQEDIAAAMRSPTVRFERFRGCGHGVFRDAPEEAFRIMREFIAS